MNHRTLKEYKKDVFDLLDNNKKLEWMYQMSEQLCNVEEYIDLLQEELKKYSDIYKKIPKTIVEDRLLQLKQKIGNNNE